MSERIALALNHVSKRFGEAVALDDATLAVRSGTVHALLGENGAGKTTLMRIAFGLVAADRGTMQVNERPARFRSPRDAIEAGIGMVHQHFTNVPAFTVAENVALGAGQARLDLRRVAADIRALGDRADGGVTLDPHQRAGDLSVSGQQKLEIVKALARGARVLILDEPTAVLAPADADELLRWLRAFVTSGGTAVLITHKLPEALAVADDVTVLRAGRTVVAGAVSRFDAGSLALAIVGESLRVPQGQTVAAGPVVAHAESLSVRRDRGALALAEATVEVRAGAIVGVAGVDGSGHLELLRVFARRQRPESGRLMLPAAIGFIPDDRQHDGLVLDFTLVENVALRGAGARRGRMPWRALSSRTEELLRVFDVRGGSGRARARNLSGGNQQRLVLARELADRPALVVAENPTRGLDVRATAAIHQRLRDAGVAGTALMFHSSDLDEILELSTRVLVVHAGRVSEGPKDRNAIGRAMLGLPWQ